MTLTVHAIDHIVINVRDPEISASWYQRALGVMREDFVPAPGRPSRIALKFGSQKLNLRPVTARQEDWFTADHAQAGSDDLCFLTRSNPESVIRHLEAQGIAIEQGPVEKQGARGVLISVYCRDPDGSLIEIASYKE
jgi:catechol 2,3-dioxygenase-like lactoylglutathione lyase family enzyme